MNHILAVCDAEEAYASSLVNYINQKEGFPFRAQYFSTPEKLNNFSKEQKTEVVLASELFFKELKALNPADKVILLSEDSTNSYETEDIVCKYQSCEMLLKNVLTLLAKEPGKHSHITRKKKLKVIGFYSPIKRGMQTSFALTMGQLLARRGGTLYINLEPCSGLDILMGKSFAKDLSDLLYYLQNGKNGIAFYLSGITEQINGLDILPPMRCQMDLLSISSREWLQLFYEIEVCTAYEYLLLHLSDSIQGLFEILRHCDRIYTITAEDGFAMAKMDQYERMLNQCRYEDIMEKSNRCSFAEISYLPKQLERFTVSELAATAKEYLKEDFYVER